MRCHIASRREPDWLLFRLYNVDRTPGAFELRAPLERHAELTPTTYRASFH